MYVLYRVKQMIQKIYSTLQNEQRKSTASYDMTIIQLIFTKKIDTIVLNKTDFWETT